jgi:hypothetical protein
VLLYTRERVLNGASRGIALTEQAGESLSANLERGEGALREKGALRDAEG